MHESASEYNVYVNNSVKETKRYNHDLFNPIIERLKTLGAGLYLVLSSVFARKRYCLYPGEIISVIHISCC
jgi:hypothetical protein